MLLVTDDEGSAKNLKEKLVFLRKDDNVIISKYEDAVHNVEISQSEIVLIHENIDGQKTINLIEKLRENEGLCIILIVNSYNQELILAAYDSGVDDFIIANSPNYEFVVRIVGNMKNNTMKLAGMRNKKLLEQVNVIDELTGLYSYDYAKQVIENRIDDDLITDGSFMAISLTEDGKMKFSIENMVQALKKSIRSSDILTLGRGTTFYIFLPCTDFNGALIVFEKIKENFGDGICAGISDIAHKDFTTFENEALKSLSDASATNSEYVFTEKDEETLEDWLDKPRQKGYKIFRQIFNKKLEKVIAPVFFRLQKIYEEKLFKTEIEQYTNSEQCVFHLRNKRQDSTLRIVYPGFTKIIVYIAHEGLDSPENKEIQLSLAKVTQKELINIVENFIKEFKEGESNAK